MADCLKPYKNIFGIPRQGIHSIRLFDWAVVDIVGTIVVAWLIAHYGKLDFPWVLIALFILGQILHLIFGVETRFISLLKTT